MNGTAQLSLTIPTNEKALFDLIANKHSLGKKEYFIKMFHRDDLYKEEIWRVNDQVARIENDIQAEERDLSEAQQRLRTSERIIAEKTAHIEQLKLDLTCATKERDGKVRDRKIIESAIEKYVENELAPRFWGRINSDEYMECSIEDWMDVVVSEGVSRLKEADNYAVDPGDLEARIETFGRERGYRMRNHDPSVFETYGQIEKPKKEFLHIPPEAKPMIDYAEASRVTYSPTITAEDIENANMYF